VNPAIPHMFRTFERKLCNALQRSSHACKRQRETSEVSLAAIDDVMARSLLLLTSRMPAARSMLLVL